MFRDSVFRVSALCNDVTVANLVDSMQTTTWAKLAGDAIPVGQILAFRFGIQVLLLVPLAAAFGVSGLLNSSMIVRS